jgi:hypothetical protein
MSARLGHVEKFIVAQERTPLTGTAASAQNQEKKGSSLQLRVLCLGLLQDFALRSAGKAAYKWSSQAVEAHCCRGKRPRPPQQMIWSVAERS